MTILTREQVDAFHQFHLQFDRQFDRICVMMIEGKRVETSFSDVFNSHRA